jgi:hypothetical protein
VVLESREKGKSFNSRQNNNILKKSIDKYFRIIPPISWGILLLTLDQFFPEIFAGKFIGIIFWQTDSANKFVVLDGNCHFLRDKFRQ